jgi:hypothetical protein
MKTNQNKYKVQYEIEKINKTKQKITVNLLL